MCDTFLDTVIMVIVISNFMKPENTSVSKSRNKLSREKSQTQQSLVFHRRVALSCGRDRTMNVVF